MFKYKYISSYILEDRSGQQDNSFIQGNNNNNNSRQQGMVTRLQGRPMFKQERPGSSRYLKSTTYTLRKEWNLLPLSIRRLDDYVLCKYAIKRHFRGMSDIENSPVTENDRIELLFDHV